jgi:hypothetical protein
VLKRICLSSRLRLPQGSLCLVTLCRFIYSRYQHPLPIPVAARAKAWVFGRSLAGIAGSNYARPRIPVSCECCLFLGRGLSASGDHSSRGVLPSAVCLSVITKPKICEGPGPLGLSSHKKFQSCKVSTLRTRFPCYVISYNPTISSEQNVVKLNVIFAFLSAVTY